MGKKILEQKFISFVENDIDYKLAKNYVYGNYNENYDGEYVITPNQYDKPNKIAKWFIELEFDSKSNDDFLSKLLKILNDGKKQKYPHFYISNDIDILIKNTLITKKEYGHLFRLAWYLYEGCPFGNGTDFSTNIQLSSQEKLNNPDTISNIGKLLVKYVDNFNTTKEKLNLFNSLITKEYEKNSKYYEKEKRNTLKITGINFLSIKKLIQKSTLHQDIKEEIFENIKVKYQDIEEIIEDGMIVHMDTLMNIFGNNLDICIKHFSDNLNNFPVNITTEDSVLLYKK